MIGLNNKSQRNTLKFFLSIITESINKLTEFLERHPAVKNNWKSGMTDLEDLRWVCLPREDVSNRMADEQAREMDGYLNTT